MKNQIKLAAIAAVFAVVGAANADTTFMDQIGSTPGDMTGNLYTSQYFSDFTAHQYDAAAGDDFTLSAASNIHEVDVFGGFFSAANPSFANITGWQVNFYSSTAAATSNLVGNGGTASFAGNAGNITINTGYDSALAATGLVSITGLNINLGAGTWYVSIIPTMSFAVGGEWGAAQSNMAAANPGGSNGFQSNPGGGFAITGNEQNVAVNLAYRVSGAAAAPEPASMAFLGLGLVGLVARRRRSSK